MAVEIAEPSAEQQATAEREHVGVHDPYQQRFGEAEVCGDRRQCHVDDRGVEHDHEDAEA